MKKIMTATTGVTTLLASSRVLAHMGEHSHTLWIDTLSHLLSEHGLLILPALLLAGFVFRRLFRV
jgi:hypothetical protein